MIQQVYNAVDCIVNLGPQRPGNFTMKLTIGLLWHTLHSPNLGVDALTRANIAILKSAATRTGILLDFILLGLNEPNAPLPDLADVRQGPSPSLMKLARGRWGYLKALRDCDLVIDISEGDSFADIYGARRFLLQGYSKVAALQSGRPLILAPQTIGPFNSKWSRWLAKHLMRHAFAVFARDGLSTKMLHSLGMRDNIDEFIDVAFRLPYQSHTVNNTGKQWIGINVSGLLYSEGSRFGLTLNYANLTDRFIQYFADRNDVQLWIVPHVLAPGAPDDDLEVSKGLANRFPFIKIAPAFSTSSDAKSFVSNLDLLVAARMHASIAAFSSGVPVMPIAYSRKFNGLYSTLGYNFLIDGRTATTDEAYLALTDAINRTDEMKVQISRGMELAQARLDHYEDFLVDTLLGFKSSEISNLNGRGCGSGKKT